MVHESVKVAFKNADEMLYADKESKNCQNKGSCSKMI